MFSELKFGVAPWHTWLCILFNMHQTLSQSCYLLLRFPMSSIGQGTIMCFRIWIFECFTQVLFDLDSRHMSEVFKYSPKYCYVLSSMLSYYIFLIFWSYSIYFFAICSRFHLWFNPLKLFSTVILYEASTQKQVYYLFSIYNYYINGGNSDYLKGMFKLFNASCTETHFEVNNT